MLKKSERIPAALKAIALENILNLGELAVAQAIDFGLFSRDFGVVVLGIGSGRQIAAMPAVTLTLVLLTAADRPAASAKGTVSPSAMPITTSRTVSVVVKCFSTCGRGHDFLLGREIWEANRRLSIHAFGRLSSPGRDFHPR